MLIDETFGPQGPIARSLAGFEARPGQVQMAQLIERGIRARLTWRERQVMRHVARGCGLLEIARLLGVSRSTAKFHSHNALRKLGAGSRGEVMRVLFLDSGSQS